MARNESLSPTKDKDDPEINYRVAPPGSKRRCDRCSMWRDGRCTLVKGLIASNGTCNKFEPR